MRTESGRRILFRWWYGAPKRRPARSTFARAGKAGVVGSMQTRTYDAQDGTKRYVTEVVADEVEFLTPKSEGEPDPPRPAKNAQPTPIDDDDLPF